MLLTTSNREYHRTATVITSAVNREPASSDWGASSGWC